MAIKLRITLGYAKRILLLVRSGEFNYPSTRDGRELMKNKSWNRDGVTWTQDVIMRVRSCRVYPAQLEVSLENVPGLMLDGMEVHGTLGTRFEDQNLATVGVIIDDPQLPTPTLWNAQRCETNWTPTLWNAQRCETNWIVRLSRWC